MNRRDMEKFVEVKEIFGNREEEDSFSFFIDDVTEDLEYK